MSAHGEPMMLVATDDGLFVGGADEISPVEELAGREVVALGRSADARWALVDGRELWNSDDGRRWAFVAKTPRRRASCVAITSAGLLVGTARAHLLRLDDGRFIQQSPFDEAPGRDAWYTPWGAPPEVRSISGARDGAIYVNVHVGGVLRSRDGGESWRATLDIDDDVHQVLAHPTRPGLVLVAAAAGFGVSGDGGDTWRWLNEGLSAHYCRAVAVDGETVLVSASTGHRGRESAVYRRRLDDRAPFERCQVGLPEWFSDNVDSNCVALCGRTAALGAGDGTVFVSRDAGETWACLEKDLGAVRALSLD